METANYLWNRLLIRSRSHGELIPEEAWTNKHQNLSHIRIFESFILANIPDKKRSKSDYQKTWQRILIGYSPDTSKHFCIWASQTKQVIIVSEPFIDESDQRAKLLSQWPMDSPLMKRKAPAREPRPRGRPRKNLAEQPAQINQRMADPDPEEDQQPEQPNEKPINQNKNKVAMSMIKASSKIHEPKSYDKAINDPIHGR